MYRKLETDRNHIVVFRFSALGDVAMTVPVIKQWLEQHPTLSITVVSTSFTEPLFTNIPRCNFIAADVKGRHAGIFGLFRLFKEIKRKCGKALIADLHQVLRTTILRLFFRFYGYTIATIDKGRSEKRNLTSKKKKKKTVLKSQHERYADVFRKLGFQGKLQSNQINAVDHQSTQSSIFPFSDDKINIGVAPFAKHQGKCYPHQKMKEVLQNLNGERYRIFLFGGGKNEIDILSSWNAEMDEKTILVAGKHSLADELNIISKLDMMVSMDSANMHLASLYSVPVVSIWGATHPDVGFMGFGQSKDNIVTLELSCSPCSVFGNKPCWRGDFACMNELTPEQVYSAISQCALKIGK